MVENTANPAAPTMPAFTPAKQRITFINNFEGNEMIQTGTDLKFYLLIRLIHQ